MELMSEKNSNKLVHGKKVKVPEEKLEAIREKELLGLGKLYKKMERDKKIIGGKFAKQRKVITILKKENANILTDLSVATGSTNAKKNTTIWNNLLVMLNEYTHVNEMIRRDETWMNEIEYQIKTTSKRVTELQAQQTTDIKLQLRELDGRKTVEKLENRLYNVNKIFCTICAENWALREDIEHYLQERTHFNKLWEGYIVKLNAGKKIMLDLIEQATITYDQREEWCSNLQALRNRAQTDVVFHRNEMSELQREIDHNKKLQDFLAVKHQKRIMHDLQRRLHEKRKKNREQMMVHVAEYQSMLDEVRRITEEDDLKAIGKKFNQCEEENFSRYLYVNDLTEEMEQLSSKLAQYRTKCDAERKVNEDAEALQKLEIEHLEEKLQVYIGRVHNAKHQYSKTSEQLKGLLGGIENLFKICKCSNAPILELLGNNANVTKYNCLLYLNVLEKRVSEMLRIVYFRQMVDKKLKHHLIKDSLGHPEKLEVTEYVPSSPCPLCMETAFCYDLIEKLQRPLSKDCVTVKLNSYLSIPDAVELVHNVSVCHLPKSRQIIQRRYQ